MLISIRKCLTNRLIYKVICRHYSNLNKSNNVLTSGVLDMPIPNLPIQDYVFEHFSKWDENRIAVECGLSGRKYTYKQVQRKTNGVAKSLRKILKLQEGDVVALLLPNIPEYPIAALSILSAGLVITTINPIYTSDEISKQLSDSSAKVIITLIDLYPQTITSLKQCKLNIPIITIKTENNQSVPTGAVDFMELTEQTNLDFSILGNIAQDDLAVIPYSSGTTGLPKGVELCHSNIVANMEQIMQPNILVTSATKTHQPVTVCVLPMFHIYGFTICTLQQLASGVKIVTLPKFTPETYINSLAEYKPHVLYIAPPIAIFLANHPKVKREYFEHLETVFSGAAPLGALDEERLVKKASKPINMLQGYGLSETSPVVATLNIETKRKFNCKGTIGTPLNNTEIKLISLDSKNGDEGLGPNQKGELLIRGPQVMKQYHNRPEETKNAFLNGWFRTGDVMYYDDNGLLYVTDRIKELIKVKGFQVAPAEIEEILRNYPNVDDAAVIGIPHSQYGEVPKAFIVEKPGSHINLDKLNEFVNAKISSYKQLKGGIEMIDKIPKNAAGKILRRELKMLS